ncbi:hypothetical protein D8T25_23025 [Vibrio vulnificus]|nr:hypothetical protein D8T25_23025 [Vibrio vulnificus]
MLGQKAYNKQFKSDSARLAFLVWFWSSVYGGQMKCRGSVLHTLIGRYVTGEINGTQIFKFKRSRISAKSR